jgi:flavin-dependent dehydrogenase
VSQLDLLVLGGGPAGLSAAIAARLEGMRVALVEARKGPVDKACGEGIMPAGIRALAALGMDPLPGRPFTGVRYEHALDPSCGAEGRFSAGPGLGVRRTSLSEALEARARSLGVEFRQAAVRDLRLDRNRVEAAGLCAPHLVAADGLHSTTRRRLGLSRPPKGAPRFGVVRHLRCAPWSDHVVVLLGEGAEAYVTPLGEEAIGVAILGGRPLRFDAVIARFPTLRARIEGCPIVARDRGAGPFEQRVARRVAGRVLLVGDAAGYLDPLTGEGVSLGVRTARAAVACIARGEPQAYEARYEAITRRYYRLTRLLLAAVSRPRAHRALIATARVPALFRAVLDLLDGSGTAQ